MGWLTMSRFHMGGHKTAKDYLDAQFTYSREADGTITAGGAATGEGTLDATSSVALAGGRYQVETVGTLGGWDVSRSYQTTAIGL